MGVRSFSLIFFLISFSYGLSFITGIQNDINSPNFERKLVALLKVINYMVQRPHQMNVDAIYGMTLVEAHLTSALRHKNVQYLKKKHISTLETILKLCKLSRQTAAEIVTPESKAVFDLNKALNRPEIWMNKIIWQNGSLGRKTISRDLKSISTNLGQHLLYRGRPNEDDSDQCLAGLTHKNSKGVCQISDPCMSMLKSSEIARGYPLTHRLLLVQVTRALRCEKRSIQEMSRWIPVYCDGIYQDMIDLEAMNFPMNGRDLAMEQIVLCGAEGFMEFTQKRFEDLILSWPHDSGCFSGTARPWEQKFRRVRRRSDSSDFGCDNHATGVAAAALAVLTREDIETYINVGGGNRGFA